MQSKHNSLLQSIGFGCLQKISVSADFCGDQQKYDKLGELTNFTIVFNP